MVVWFENFWNTRGSFVIFSFDCFQDFVRQITLLPIAHGMRASAYVICMCACVWVCVSIQANICIYTYMFIHVYRFIYIYTNAYTYVHIYIHVHIYIYIHICTYLYITIYIDSHVLQIHVHIYIYTHTYKYRYLQMHTYITLKYLYTLAPTHPKPRASQIERTCHHE